MKSHADTVTCHHEEARLLPWYVNDTLPADQAHRVAEHLDLCATCRADAAALGPLRTLLRTPSTVEYTPQAGFARLLARIDAAEQPAPAAPAVPVAPAAAAPLPLRGWRGPARWLAAAVVVQAVALGVMATALLGGRAGGHDDAYQTLTSRPAAPTPAQPALRVVFSGELTLADLQTLLRSLQLQAVAGPTEAGLFTLVATSPQALGPALQRLRADPRVRFAEPLGSEPVVAPR